MNSITKWAIGLLVVIVLVVLATQLGGNNSDENKSIKIGVAVAKTGVAVEWGNDELRATEIAFDEQNAKGGINGIPVELIVEDTKSDNVGTANAVTKLATVDKVPLILGPTWGDSFQSGNSIARDNGVVMVNPSVAVEVLDRSLLGDYFATWWPQMPEIQKVIEWLKITGNDKVVQVYDQDAFNSKFSELFNEEAKRSNLPILDKIITPVGDKDFRTKLAKVKALKPKAFFVELQDVGLFGTFMKQMKEQGIDAVVVSTATTQNEQLVRDFGAVVEGLVYSYPAVVENESYKNLVKKYSEKYGTVPSGPSFVNAYNAALAVIEALKISQSLNISIVEALTKVDIDGVGIERISFGENRQINQVNFKMKSVRGGKFVDL